MPRSTAIAGALVTTYQLPGSSDKAQLVGFGQPKDLFALATRSGISAADLVGATFDAGAAPQASTQDAAALWVGGDTDTASSSIGFVVVLFEASGKVLCVSQAMSLAAGAVYRASGRFCAIGAPAVVDLAGASHYAIVVTAVTGSWNLYAKLF